MGLEWAHTEVLSESESLVVVDCSLCGVRGLTLCGELAQQPAGPGLSAAFLVVTGEHQETRCQAVRLHHTTGYEVALAQVEHHTIPFGTGGLRYLDLVEQVQGLGDLPGPCIGHT